jgi:cytochrome c-type biogenesis protein CcmH
MTDERLRSLPGPALALLAGLVLLGHSRGVIAQEKPQLDPETIAILGDPNASEASLDASLVEVLGRPKSGPPAQSVVAEQAADIFTKLRCPVCQGVSIADSPSGMATNMRGQVRDLVAKGYSEEQVLSYFERSYGEFVRLEPPLRGLNVMLWVLPAVVLVGGGFFVYRKARRPVATAQAPSEPARSEGATVDPELARYLERIRRDSGTSA